MGQLRRPCERAFEILEQELELVASAEGDRGRLVVVAGHLVHRAARAVAFDVSGEGDGDLEREQLRLVARVLLLQPLEELHELLLVAVAELAGPQTVLARGVGDERGDVEEAIRAMERHLADAAVGELLGDGADQCQHRGTSGWNELVHPIRKWPSCQP